ncbi:MAG: hypothetical protein M1839_004762 [Geoglossum umbratile]|nr:MAG: hypothetical protein M1839_004762 [Geoglossum umbratile]
MEEMQSPENAVDIVHRSQNTPTVEGSLALGTVQYASQAAKFDTLLHNGVINREHYDEVTRGSATCDDVVMAIKAFAAGASRASVRNDFARFLSRVGIDTLERLQRFTSVIDVLVQSRANVGCLVWGGLKLVIQVGHDVTSARDAIFDLFDKLIVILPRLEEVERVLKGSRLLEDGMIRLYDCIIDFCVEALKFCRKPFLKQFVGSLFGRKPVVEKFHNLCEKIWFAEGEVFKIATFVDSARFQEAAAERFEEVLRALERMETSLHPVTTSNDPPASRLAIESRHVSATTTAGAPTNWNHYNLECGFPSPFYIPRKREVESISIALTQCGGYSSAGRAVITAMAGFGASQSAAAFACHNRRSYDLVFRLDCRRPEFALHGFDQLFEAISFTNPPSTRSGRHTLLKSCLETTNHKWLLVFDNCTRECTWDIRYLIPHCNGHIIFTTSDRHVPELLGLMENHCVRLAKLTEGEGTRLLLSKSAIGDVSPQGNTFAGHVVRFLDGHPQAISCVASHLRNATRTFEEVYKDLQDPRALTTLMTDEVQRESVLETFSSARQGLSTNALVLLCLMAIFQGAAVSRDILFQLSQVNAKSISIQ